MNYLTPAHVLVHKDTPLAQRLVRFYDDIQTEHAPLSNDLRLETARAALLVVCHVQRTLDSDSPPVGTRDLSLLRALLSLVFQWGVDPSHDMPVLFSLLSSLLSLLFPRGVHAQPPQTFITTSILNKHVPELLGPSIALAWLPKSQWPQDAPDLLSLRPPILRLLDLLPLAQVMTDLGAILSASPPPRPHVRKVCSSLLTKSLLRPGGVRALFAAVFGEKEGSEDPLLEKYERTASILMTVPAGHTPEEYFPIIIPRLMDLLSQTVPATYRRATSFSISRMLDPECLHYQLISSLVSPFIHHPLVRSESTQPTPSAALSMLTTLLLNTDPSPVFITHVLSPVLPALYALMFHLDVAKASDPVIKESVKGLLATWGRVVEARVGIDTLWSVVQSERTYWEVDASGNIKHGAPEPKGLALLTPKNFDDEGELVNENFLDLYPDPAHFVRYIKSLDRLDVVSELFVRLLEAYNSADSDRDADPSRGLLYLQLIVQMQTRLSDESSAANILRKPEHILSFINHVFASHTAPRIPSAQRQTKHSRGLGLENLKIVDEDVGDNDSDNEPAEPDDAQTVNGMTETAINLLLSILEANPGLSARNAPVLDEIFSLLEPYSNDPSETIRNLAREARMVMTARFASSSTTWSTPREGEENSREIYQKALKLLQDPILPVRAHGLLLLRQLVSSHPREQKAGMDPALVPAILSIFMQSVQDDDSYIFLNAVQGLSAMVDVFGKDVLESLLETYTRNLSASTVGTLSKQEVDAKVRVGEALGQVIRRCGGALSIYSNIIVPRLVFVFGSRYAPTVLRTSAVSLLSECIKTSAISILCYTNDVATGMIDFLQVETTPASRPPRLDDDGERGRGDQDKDTEVLDSTPTSVDPKLAPLRRAVLHFWTVLVNELTRATYDGVLAEKLPTALLKRAKVTLGYVASSDEDGRVRVMAREASKAIDGLNKATLGV